MENPEKLQNKEIASNVVPVVEIIQDIDTSGMPSLENWQRPKKEQGFGSPQCTWYAGKLWELFNIDAQVKKAFRKFEDQIVIDLGAGESENGYFLAEASGAKAYIAVEPYWADRLSGHFKSSNLNTLYQRPEENKSQSLKNIPIAIAPEDMLTFLKRLPDNSVSILISGVNEAILGSNVFNKNEYINNVKNEIKRVLSSDGALIAFSSYVFIPSGLTKEQIYLDVIQATKTK